MNFCKHCNKETTNPKFCSKSCSASVNNRGVNRHSTTHPNCRFCKKEIKRPEGKHCSYYCQQAYGKRKRLRDAILSNSFTTRRLQRAYLSRFRGYMCASCGISEWNEKKIVLEIDHIDGNSKNNCGENLRYLCPNCHSQTSTYKARNSGKGRAYRRKRYAEGKSY